MEFVRGVRGTGGRCRGWHFGCWDFILYKGVLLRDCWKFWNKRFGDACEKQSGDIQTAAQRAKRKMKTIVLKKGFYVRLCDQLFQLRLQALST